MRLYTEKDVSTLLRRAAELQSQAEGGPASGLTLAELKSIAAESGIDPKFVEQAALSSGQVEKREGRYYFWGGPSKILSERTAAGELPEEAWPDLVAALQDGFGQTGETSQVGRGFEWRYGYMGTTLHSATVTTRKGKTTLRVRRSLENEAAVIWMLPVMFAILFALLFNLIGIKEGGLSPLLTAPVTLAVFVATFFGCRAGFGAFTRGAQEKTDALFDRFEALVAREAQATGPVAEAEAAPATTTSRVALPDADEAAADEPAVERSRTRA